MEKSTLLALTAFAFAQPAYSQIIESPNLRPSIEARVQSFQSVSDERELIEVHFTNSTDSVLVNVHLTCILEEIRTNAEAPRRYQEPMTFVRERIAKRDSFVWTVELPNITRAPVADAICKVTKIDYSSQ